MGSCALKLANVSTVPKGDRSEEFIVGSFGSISILPVLAKVFRVHCSLAAIRLRAIIAKGLREQHAL